MRKRRWSNNVRVHTSRNRKKLDKVKSGITANAKLSCASARVAKKGARPPSLSLSLSSGSPNSKRTFSPRYTPMHATCDFIGSRTYYNDDRKSWNESSKIGVMNQRYF